MVKEELQEKEPIAYRSLYNALKNRKVAHSYLFSGEYSPLKIDTAYLLAQSIIEGKDDFIYGIQHDSDGKKIDPYAMYEKLPSVDDDFIIASEDDLKLEENSEDKVDDYEDYKF